MLQEIMVSQLYVKRNLQWHVLYRVEQVQTSFLSSNLSLGLGYDLLMAANDSETEVNADLSYHHAINWWYHVHCAVKWGWQLYKQMQWMSLNFGDLDSTTPWNVWRQFLSSNGFALVKTKNVNGEKSLSKYRLSETTKKIKVQKLMHRTNLLRFEIQYSSLLQ